VPIIRLTIGASLLVVVAHQSLAGEDVHGMPRAQRTYDDDENDNYNRLLSATKDDKDSVLGSLIC
jgi:hypothetical protein